MGNKLSTSVILLIILAVLFAGFILFPRDAAAPEGKVMNIESYVTQNISTLSPEKEVLGGTFYVTAIQAADGQGVASYEDGHNAYTADFTYTMSDREGVQITSFRVR